MHQFQVGGCVLWALEAWVASGLCQWTGIVVSKLRQWLIRQDIVRLG